MYEVVPAMILRITDRMHEVAPPEYFACSECAFLHHALSVYITWYINLLTYIR